jgi:hypothetical protein
MVLYSRQNWDQFLSLDQKGELGNFISAHALACNLGDLGTIEKANIKSSYEISSKFDALLETSNTDKEKEKYDFENFSLRKKMGWALYGISQELTLSVNINNQRRGYQFNKELLTSKMNSTNVSLSENITIEESIVIEDDEYLPLEEELIFLQSVQKMQFEMNLLDETPINELNKQEIALLDEKYPGAKEEKGTNEKIQSSNLKPFFATHYSESTLINIYPDNLQENNFENSSDTTVLIRSEE